MTAIDLVAISKRMVAIAAREVAASGGMQIAGWLTLKNLERDYSLCVTNQMGSRISNWIREHGIRLLDGSTQRLCVWDSFDGLNRCPSVGS